MSVLVQFVVDIEIEDDDVDVEEVDISYVEIEGVPEHAEWGYSSRKIGGFSNG